MNTLLGNIILATLARLYVRYSSHLVNQKKYFDLPSPHCRVIYSRGMRILPLEVYLAPPNSAELGAEALSHRLTLRLRSPQLMKQINQKTISTKLTSAYVIPDPTSTHNLNSSLDDVQGELERTYVTEGPPNTLYRIIALARHSASKTLRANSGSFRQLKTTVSPPLTLH